MTRKIALSALVIVAVAALVIGVSMAIFSDNVPSDEQAFAAGTVNIQVGGVDEYFDTTLDMANMEPGDCTGTQTVRIDNVGSLPVNLWMWTYFWGDLASCDPNADCNLHAIIEFADQSDADDEGFIAAGGWEEYDVKVCLPLCAGNNCQGDTGTMQIFVHAVQASNLDGFECVKLEDKAAPNWVPNPTTDPHGNLCYKVEGDDLHVVLNAYGLTPDAYYQLDLTGGDTNDPHDAGCTMQDDNLALMVSGDLYSSGYWNWPWTPPLFLEATCVANNGGEGVWNYAGVYGDVQADSTGAISYEAVLDGLPPYDYVVKAHVKEITGTPPGTAWTGILSEVDYLHFTIP